MVLQFGWAGTVLNVDLTRGRIKKEQLSLEFARKYLGGKGFNSARLFDLLSPGVDALSPENVIMFAVGPLAGTLYPGNTRLTVTAKSPLTDIFGDTNIGGSVGAELKYAGYDQLLVFGKSKKPVYLWIDGGEVELREASHLWGTTTWEAGLAIRQELGDPEIQILTIGQAGENLVRFANIISPLGRAAGRTGMGAVMGSKNLKAIAIRGTRGVKVAQPQEFFRVCKESTVKGTSEPHYDALRGGGSPMWADLFMPAGGAGVKNYRKTMFPNWLALSGERMQAGGEFNVRKRACFSCPVCCSGFFNVRSGEFAQAFGRCPEFGTTEIGLRCEIDNLPALLKTGQLCDQYGIDVVSGQQMLAWTMDCYSMGILTKEDCDGIAPEWGNYNAVIELIHKIAKREGFGDLLAEGERRAAETLGRGSEKYMYHIKGLAPVIGDPRTNKVFGFPYFTATRGADHLSANVMWIPYLLSGSELGKKVMAEWEEGKATTVLENVSCIIHSAETCTRTGGSFELIAKALSTATGITFSVEELLTTGERIYNVQKAFNSREGLRRKDDYFPVHQRIAAEPVADGPYQGEVLNLDPLLDDYYEARGWDKETGLQTVAKLKELDLDFIIPELKKVDAVK